MVERPVLVKINRQKWLEEPHQLYLSLLLKIYEGVPISELEQEIDRFHYQRLIPIPLTNWAIRPFWRDGKKVPPLEPAIRHHFSHHW